MKRRAGHRALTALGAALALCVTITMGGAVAAERSGPAPIAASPDGSAALLVDCHIDGIRQPVSCGAVRRALDPARPRGPQIDIRYVVVPALARNKLADPVFLLAGGPGQSAIAVAGSTLPLLARLNNRRDIVFVDQRGTGASAPLTCRDGDPESLGEQADRERPIRLALQCKAELLKLPYIGSESDLGLFTTWLAVQDLDAVRRALGASRIDLVGFSYGTRVALEYQRQFPGTVRRSVLDGAAPPDMALPSSFSRDNQAAFNGVLAACAAEPACARDHPDLRQRFTALLQALPRTVRGADPLSGRSETFVLERDAVLGAVRSALYVPAFAAALPEAIEAAARGDVAGLAGLAAAFSAPKAARLALGMHLTVICAEDMPRVGAGGSADGADFGADYAHSYERLCARWPRGAVPDAFYGIGPSAAPVLVLSGGADPATPPRHGERVARALGPLARHVVVPAAGHGVIAIGCLREVVFRFIDAVADGDALAVDAGCAAGVPRPLAFRAMRADGGASASSGPSR